MKNCVITAKNGDVHVDGVAMTPDEWDQLKARGDYAARVARLQRARIVEMALKSGLIRPRAQQEGDPECPT